MPGASLWWVELPEGGAKAVVGRVLEVGTETPLDSGRGFRRRVGFWAGQVAIFVGFSSAAQSGSMSR
jgi:hypothetical protein